jgi:hypothetical protein
MPTSTKEVKEAAYKEYASKRNSLRKKRERLVKAGKYTEAEAVALELNQLDRDSYYESYQSALHHQRRKTYRKDRSRLKSKLARLVKAGKCTKAIDQELKQLEQNMDPPDTPDEAPPSPMMSPAPPSPLALIQQQQSSQLQQLPPPPNYNAYIPPSVAAASPSVMLDFMDGLTMTALAHGSNNTALAIRAGFASRSARAPPIGIGMDTGLYGGPPSAALLPAGQGRDDEPFTPQDTSRRDETTSNASTRSTLNFDMYVSAECNSSSLQPRASSVEAASPATMTTKKAAPVPPTLPTDWLQEQLKTLTDNPGTLKELARWAHSVEHDSSLKDRFEMSFGATDANYPSDCKPIGLDVLHCNELVGGMKLDTIVFFSANALSDLDEMDLDERTSVLYKACQIVKLSTLAMLKFETTVEAVEMEVHGDSQLATGLTVSELLLGAPSLYKKGLIKTCEISASGVEQAVIVGLTKAPLEGCTAAGLPLIFQRYHLTLDEQNAIRAGVSALAEAEVGYLHLQKCALAGDRGTNPLVQTMHHAKKKYRGNLALCIEASETALDLTVLATGIQHGLYFSLSLKSVKCSSKGILELVTACQLEGWDIQVGVTSTVQEKWKKQTLILHDVSVGVKLDTPWLLSNGIKGAFQMELLLQSVQDPLAEFVSLTERIQTGQLFSLYLSGLNLPQGAEGALVDLLKAAATKGFILKIGKWNGIDYGHKWLVLSETKIALPEEDERERCRRLENYYRYYNPEKVHNAQVNLDKYKGRMEVLQTNLLAKYKVPIDLSWRPLDLVDRLSTHNIVFERLGEEEGRDTAPTGPCLSELFRPTSNQKKCESCFVLNPLSAEKCIACTSSFNAAAIATVKPPPLPFGPQADATANAFASTKLPPSAKFSFGVPATAPPTDTEAKSHGIRFGASSTPSNVEKLVDGSKVADDGIDDLASLKTESKIDGAKLGLLPAPDASTAKSADAFSTAKQPTLSFGAPADVSKKQPTFQFGVPAAEAAPPFGFVPNKPEKPIADSLTNVAYKTVPDVADDIDTSTAKSVAHTTKGKKSKKASATPSRKSKRIADRDPEPRTTN